MCIYDLPKSTHLRIYLYKYLPILILLYFNNNICQNYFYKIFVFSKLVFYDFCNIDIFVVKTYVYNDHWCKTGSKSKQSGWPRWLTSSLKSD